MKQDNLNIAIVTDSLFRMAGSSKVLECFAELFPDADIYTLFTLPKKQMEKSLSPSILSHKIYSSWLNKIPFVYKFYRYTLNRWPFVIEKFDFSNYDLVISSSWAVAHGVITPLDTVHVAYVHTPMRYIWDMYDLYFKNRFPEPVYRIASHFLRIWDSSASSRADFMISNSKFVEKRIKKYWDRDVDAVIYPPVNMYDGKLIEDREKYFVAGAPFEPNKGGEFLLECAKWIGFNLKIIGTGDLKKKLERKYGDCKNIEFVGWVSEEEKYEIFSKARGYIMTGIEDFGIFPVEALSCGTPVLAYGSGGALETVKEDLSGMFFYNRTVEGFKEVFDRFSKHNWSYDEIARSAKKINDKEGFKEEFKEFLVNHGVLVK